MSTHFDTTDESDRRTDGQTLHEITPRGINQPLQQGETLTISLFYTLSVHCPDFCPVPSVFLSLCKNTERISMEFAD